MFGHPGKKLMFMGSEFGQEHECGTITPSTGTCWSSRAHAGVQALVRDLNRLYRTVPALHEFGCDPAGFEWLVMHDADRGVFAWLRKGRDVHDRCLVVVNFTPEVYRDYRIRVPFSGFWREVLNTDAAVYGGTNVGNAGRASTLRREPYLR
jgi:1,4-alpha-glucan branching enzyme